MDLFWQILALISVGALILLLIFAIIEPGPLQEPRTFGRRAQPNAKDEADQDEESDETIDDASEGSPTPSQEL